MVIKYTYIYVILGICAVAVSIGKTLAVNFGISKYLSKKSYNGKFKVIKTASISFGVGYILLALASLFIVTMVMDAIYSHIRFDELLQDFLSIFYMAIIGANYFFVIIFCYKCFFFCISFFYCKVNYIPKIFLFKGRQNGKSRSLCRNMRTVLHIYCKLTDSSVYNRSNSLPLLILTK